jgi:hypothetical protein
VATVIMPHKATKFKVALAPVDCLHKEMHRHQDSFSLEFVIYSNKTQYLASWMALQDVLICVRDSSSR